MPEWVMKLQLYWGKKRHEIGSRYHVIVKGQDKALCGLKIGELNASKYHFELGKFPHSLPSDVVVCGVCRQTYNKLEITYGKQSVSPFDG